MFSIYLVPFVILINCYVIYYIKQLDGNTCECSQSSNFKKKIIKWYAYISLFVVTLFYITPFLLSSLNKKIGRSLSKILLSPTIYSFLEIYLVFGLLNIYLIFKLTRDLYTSRCKCNLDWHNRIIFYYSIILIVIYICSFIVSIDLHFQKK